jgi:acetate kinase
MVKPTAPHILIINGGSSSIRFAVYTVSKSPRLILSGKIDRVGLSDTRLHADDATGNAIHSSAIDGKSPLSVSAQLLSWLVAQAIFSSIIAVGHRLVHGMINSEPQLITLTLLEKLQRDATFHPQHLPLEIALINAISTAYPTLRQVACFDSDFHKEMPRVASQLSLPRGYEQQGIRRYGYHGLSCEFLMQQLVRLKDPAAVNGRVILAHLGNGASMTAVRDGLSVDTSMGFTPAGGMMMGSRAGDLDPGVQAFLSRSMQLGSEDFYRITNSECGLLGVSELSSDMGELLVLEATDNRAAEAISLFCYQAVKLVGAYAAVLGGLDTLVFAGGIGENLPQIRERICASLDFLGVTLHQDRNLESAPVISADISAVTVRVIATNEQLVIANTVIRVRRLFLIDSSKKLSK